MGKQISRIGVDTAGGVITGPPKSSTVYVNGSLVAIGSGVLVSDGHTISTTSSTVFIEGKGPIRKDDVDTGGDKATGSPNVFSG